MTDAHVDLVIAIIIINVAYYRTVPGAQPNQGTTINWGPGRCVGRL